MENTNAEPQQIRRTIFRASGLTSVVTSSTLVGRKPSKQPSGCPYSFVMAKEPDLRFKIQDYLFKQLKNRLGSIAIVLHDLAVRPLQ